MLGSDIIHKLFVMTCYFRYWKKKNIFPWIFIGAFEVFKPTTPNTFQFSSALVHLDTYLSRRYRLKCPEILDTSTGVAPAYRTRIRDGIAIRPSQRAFNNAYDLLRLPTITSKTREMAFQVLNHVKDVGEQRLWNTYSVSANTNRNCCGTGWVQF
jgi:hypothetical protein